MNGREGLWFFVLLLSESTLGSLLGESKGIGYEVGSLLSLVLFFNKLGGKGFGFVFYCFMNKLWVCYLVNWSKHWL